MSNKVLDQNKLVSMIKRTLRAAEQLPVGHQRDAITGSLDAILEEAEKPFVTPVNEVLH